ncbi:PPE domain-containing protein [Actinophytocola sp.]|uniref:PPE domain-containing protein n=1 Tax=Actinophytocola sp. TaxID=1872138 RepID=UPI003D6A263A
MTVRGPGFFGYRWESNTHEQLYHWVRTDAKGAGVVTEADQAWHEFTDLMTASRDRIERLQREAGVTWEGQAAASMSGAVSPIGRWAEESATAGVQTKASLQQIADGFVHVANSMPEPVAVPSKLAQGMPTDFAGMLAGQTDEDAVDQRSQQAHLRAVELMNGYTANSIDSADTAGTFADPPEIGVTAAERTEPGGRAGGVIDGNPLSDSENGGPDEADGPGAGGAPAGAAPSESGGAAPSETGSAAPSETGSVAPGTGSQVTDPSRVVAGPSAPAPPSPVGGQGGAPANPFVPGTGVLNDPVTGRQPGGGNAGGGGNAKGGNAKGGNAGGGSGRGTGGRGGVVGAGPGPRENAAAFRATPPTGARGGAGTGMAPVGAGGGRGEEDRERDSPAYLKDYNDDFWDDTPPVAPAVIGEDD